MSQAYCKYIHHTYHGYCGPGFIYIAVDGDLYKIGCTKEEGTARHVYKSAGALASVAARFYHLNKDHKGRDFKLLHVIYTPICVRGLEKTLHSMFDDKRASKYEWFRLTKDDVDLLLNMETFDGHELTHIGIKQ